VGGQIGRFTSRRPLGHGLRRRRRSALLRGDDRSSVQDQFRSYVDVRLAQISGPDANDHRTGLATQLDDLRSGIWTTTVAAVPHCDSPQAAMLLIAALNDMFDAATRHDASFNAHTPTAIVVLLAVVAVVASILVGYDLGTHNRFEWLHTTLFAALVSSTIWVIYDLEMPRYGVIRVDDYDQTMHEVREDFDRVPSAARSR
jgi:hypothetical protein